MLPDDPRMSYSFLESNYGISTENYAKLCRLPKENILVSVPPLSRLIKSYHSPFVLLYKEAVHCLK